MPRRHDSPSFQRPPGACSGLRRVACAAGLLALVSCAGVAFAQTPGPRHGRLFPPQDLGLLEGPDRDAWQQPGQVMDALGIADGAFVADVGAGGGWFTVRLARRVGPRGLVYAQDVQRQMIDAIDRRVQREGLRNVRLVLGQDDDTRLPGETLDAVLMVDAYHEVENRVELLRSIRASLKPTGRFGLVDFKMDGFGPGPDMNERIDPEEVVRDAAQAGLRLIAHETFLPFQYLLVFGR
jgi:predicted methyltransferase